MRSERNVVVYWIGGPLAAFVLGACLIPLREVTLAANLTFAFMALTIVVAEFGGRAAGVATALASALSLDFFLTRPFFRLAIDDKHDVISFLGLGVCGIIAGALGSSRHSRPDETATPAEVLDAEFRLERMRALAWTHLCWALAISILVWIEALWHRLPGVIAWIVVLAQGFFLALAAAYAAVQEHWARWGTRQGRTGRLVVRKPWSDVEDVRSALWFALGLMSLVPWAYVAFGRQAPVDVLYGVIACSATVVLLLALLPALTRVRAPAETPSQVTADGRRDT